MCVCVIVIFFNCTVHINWLYTSCIILKTSSKGVANSTLEHIRPRWHDKVVLKHFEKIRKNK